MKTLTIYVLSHAHIRLAARARKSINNQLDPNFIVNPITMVNTNDLSLYQKFKDSSDSPDTVLHSWSNGSPGAGKNACIRDWVNNEVSEYMMIVDGDDWLYPRALWHLSNALNDNIALDYLGLQTLDVVSPNKLTNSHQIRKDPDLYLSTWGEKQPNMTEISPRLLWMLNIVKFHSVARTVLISRNVVNGGYGITYYPEDMTVYEDMVYNCKLLCQHSNTVINYHHISCSGIYIADHGVGGQVELNLYDANQDHQGHYEYHVRPLEKKYGNLNFNLIPFHVLKSHPYNTMLHKIQYINETY